MRRAYTLAEVLVTLAIVGVIAGIVFPALMHNVNKTITITKLKMIYNMLSRAFTITNTRIVDTNSASTEEWFTSMISNNIRVIKSCADTAGCWNGGTIMLDGSKPYYDRGAIGIGGDITTFITANGFMINMDGYLSRDLKSKMGINTARDGVVMYVDINGAKKPNTVGKDVFVLTYTVERGLLPAGADKSKRDVNTNCNKTGLFCLQRIISEGWSADHLRL